MAKQILIVGNGIIGLSTALAAAERGMQVTVIDRLESGGDNCSIGNAGMVVPSHFIPLAAPGVIAQGLKWLRDPESPFYVQPRPNWDLLRWGIRFYLASTNKQVEVASHLLRDLNMASRDLYVDWQERGIDCALAKRGLLMLCRTQHALDDEAAIAERARSLGVPANVLSPSETAALDPNVSMNALGSIYYPKDCHLDPLRLLRSLRTRIESLGGQFVTDTHVTSFQSHAGSITSIRTRHGDFHADEYVLCGGIWSEELAKSIQLRIPMQPGKGYSLTLPDPVELPSVCSILVEAKIAVTPIGSSLRFGGTMELGQINQAIDPRRVRGIIKNIPTYMPRFKPQHFEGIQPWCGLRPVSPDGLPYIGRAANFRNLTVATGHAMMGLSLGPITGKLVGQILAGERTAIEISRLSPDRYAS